MLSYEHHFSLLYAFVVIRNGILRRGNFGRAYLSLIASNFFSIYIYRLAYCLKRELVNYCECAHLDRKFPKRSPYFDAYAFG